MLVQCNIINLALYILYFLHLCKYDQASRRAASVDDDAEEEKGGEEEAPPVRRRQTRKGQAGGSAVGKGKGKGKGRGKGQGTPKAMKATVAERFAGWRAIADRVQYMFIV